MEILAWVSSLFAREKKTYQAEFEQWQATKLADMAIAERQGVSFDYGRAQRQDRVFSVRAKALEELEKLTKNQGLTDAEIKHRLVDIQGQLSMRAIKDETCTTEEKWAIIKAQQVVMRNSLAERRKELARSSGKARPA